MEAAQASAGPGLLRRPAVKAALAVALAAGIGYALARSWSDLEAVEWRFEPLPVAAAFAMLLLASAATAPLWLVICRGLGGEIATRPGLRVYLVSNIGKYLPGKVMHAVGRVVMLQEYGVSAAVSVTSVLVELALFLLAAFVVSLASLPLLVEHGFGRVVPFALLAVPIGLATLHPAILGRLLRIGARFLPGPRTELSRQLLPFGTILKLLAGYGVIWIAMSGALFVSAQAVYAIEPTALPAMGGIFAVSYLVGLAVPIAPSGLGAREGVMALLLSTFMPLPAAAATSVLYRTLGIVAEAVAAAIASRL